MNRASISGQYDLIAERGRHLGATIHFVEVSRLFHERAIWRRGLVPTNPGSGGVVMERAFHPLQVELDLGRWGIRASQVLLPPPAATAGLRQRFAHHYRRLRQALAWRLNPEAVRGAAWGFQIVGIREA